MIIKSTTIMIFIWTNNNYIYKNDINSKEKDWQMKKYKLCSNKMYYYRIRTHHFLSYVIRKTTIKSSSANIKYIIFKYKIDVSNIKYTKIDKIGQKQDYSQLEITIKQFCYFRNAGCCGHRI